MSTFNFTTINAYDVQHALESFSYFADVEGKDAVLGQTKEDSNALLEKVKSTSEKWNLTIDLSEEELDLLQTATAFHMFSEKDRIADLKRDLFKEFEKARQQDTAA